MKYVLLLVAGFLAGGSGASWAQPALETWVLADGRMFEAQVKLVVPGTVTFSLRSGTDQAVDIAKLSDRSKKRLAEVLGLQAGTGTVTASAPVDVIDTAKPAPPAVLKSPAPGVSMAVVPRDSAALDATDAASIDVHVGKTVTVIGKVKEVVSLGSTGHKRIDFENSDFYLFINKRQLDMSGDWHLDSLAEKTVQARGRIGQFENKLQIQLFEPNQLGVVE